jgi:hypothetical protein
MLIILTASLALFCLHKGPGKGVAVMNRLKTLPKPLDLFLVYGVNRLLS